jgi:hypothetical protein
MTSLNWADNPSQTFEAAISRLYGGIHYRLAIQAGLEQGRRISEQVNGLTGKSDGVGEIGSILAIEPILYLYTQMPLHQHSSACCPDLKR